jgi:hypothetical protein
MRGALVHNARHHVAGRICQRSANCPWDIIGIGHVREASTMTRNDSGKFLQVYNARESFRSSVLNVDGDFGGIQTAIG